MKKIFCILSALLAVATSYAQDRHVIDSLETQLKKHGTAKKELGARATPMMDTTTANIIYELSRAYRGSSPDKAMDYANQCLALSEKIGYKKGISDAYYEMGVINLGRGDYLHALEMNSKSLKIRKEIGDKEGIADSYNNLGNIYQKQGNHPEALKNLLASLSIAEEIGFKSGIGNTYHNLGMIYQAQGDNPEALKNYKVALSIKEKVGDKPNIANCFNSIGNIYQIQGNYPEALKNLIASLKIREEIGDKSGIAMSYNNLGVLYASQGKYPEALENVLIGLKMREEVGDKNTLINSYINLTDIYFKEKKYKEAVKYNTKALSLAKETGKLGGLMNGFEGLAQLDSAQGNFTEALEHYKLFISIRDSLRNRDNAKKTVELLMNYEFSKKEDSTKAEQDKKDVLAKAELEKQKLTNELLTKQYDDSLAQKEHEKKLTALNMQYNFNKAQDSTKAEQAKLDVVTEKELQKQKLVRNGFIGGFGIMLLFSGLFLFQRNRISKEKVKSENLLLNILPAEVAEELKNKGSAEAKHFDNVTVLFTDFKSFTTVSEQLSPQELVNELHACFKQFDEICGKYNIEKIKTIGDAYLAVCGLPLADEKHAENVVNAALEIREFMARRSKELGAKTFEIRIGINSGSVVAGIVGVKKFAYDIWGDTVNTAARMEQHSEAGKINILETTYELVKDKFMCEYRGEIDAKNKGMLKMYFVEGMK